MPKTFSALQLGFQSPLNVAKDCIAEIPSPHLDEVDEWLSDYYSPEINQNDYSQYAIRQRLVLLTNLV